MKKLINILNQPHPGYGNWKLYFRTVLGITIVVFLILSIFQPFQIRQHNIFSNRFFTAGIYSLGAAATMSLNVIWMFVFLEWFHQKKWTLGKEMVFLTYQMCCIAVVVWLINNMRHAIPEEDASFSNSFFLAFAIGIIPYSIATLARHIYLLRHHLKEAERINEKIRMAGSKINECNEIPSELVLSIPRLSKRITLTEFLFAESKGNNLCIQSFSNGQLVTHFIRSTLNEFEQANGNNSQLFRCHRSYMINTDKILQFKGNAAGYQVVLHTDLPAIIVSRSNVEQFKELIAAHGV